MKTRTNTYKCGVRSAECEGQNPKAEGRSPKEIRNPKAESEAAESEIGSPNQVPRRPAAVVFLARFLCAGSTLALLVSGCAGSRPLKGGKATTTRNQAGLIQQSVAQGENASQPSKQDHETIEVRTYTLPAWTSAVVLRNAWRISSAKRRAANGACILFLAVMAGTLALSRSAAAVGARARTTLNKRLVTGVPCGASYAISAAGPVCPRPILSFENYA